MTWFFAAISAYLLFAVVAVLDKILLKPGRIDFPIVFAFYTGFASILTLLLIPFVGFKLIALPQLLLCLASGAIFIVAVLGYYTVLDRYSASKVIPGFAGFVPPFTFLLAFLFLGERLSQNYLLAFVLLVIGGLLATYEAGETFFQEARHAGQLVCASLLFSIAAVISKYIFAASGFWNGFLWMRIGSFLMAVGFLALPRARHLLVQSFQKAKNQTSGLFVFNQSISAAAFILQNYAIALASVALVSALESVRHVFILILALILSFFAPRILKESFTPQILVQKIGAIALVGIGLAILVI